MKAVFCSFVVVILLAPPLCLNTANAEATSEFSQIVKLHDAGVSEDVILAHVQSSAAPRPTADDIIYLHEAGVPKGVITALIQKPRTGSSDRMVARTQWQESPAPEPSTTAPVVEAPLAAPAYVEPSPVYVTDPPAIYYPYTYYPYTYYPYTYYSYSSYPYYDWGCWPTFGVGLGLGYYWGSCWGGWGHHGHDHHDGHAGGER